MAQRCILIMRSVLETGEIITLFQTPKRTITQKRQIRTFQGILFL
jgi:hypothetical protein